MTTKIPKIMHQIWIGPKPAPTKFMDTWKNKHPDFEYIRWNEDELTKRNFQYECLDAINKMTEINGKADIIRWEILYQYGGIFLDADSICIEPFDETFLSKNGFAGFENEMARKNLVATGTMGFPKHHPICRAAIDWILKNDTCPLTCGNRAWYTVGPGLLTRVLENNKFLDFNVYPSFAFLPFHFTGLKYMGHKKVYAYQEWGSTKQNYDIMNTIELPEELCMPQIWVSVLISSFNTKSLYVIECLESIKSQNGHFGMEIVWINDGSSEENTKILENELDNFIKTTRFTKLQYIKKDVNQGISKCLNEGIHLCNNEIIIKMDSDDIMLPERIKTQINFFNTNPDYVMIGSDLQMFRNENSQNILLQRTNHPTEITWEQFKQTQPSWFANHPCLAYKKSAILTVGNYDITMGSCLQDYEIELRILKHYGKIYNIPTVLLYYRLHPDQVTYNGQASNHENTANRLKVIQKILL